MDSAHLSVVAALAGSTVGGLTSIATSWLSHYVQFRARLQSGDLRRREELYRTFIEEASRTYGHALQHDEPDPSRLVSLYALVSRMRVVSSAPVVATAESVVHRIIDAYLAPNRSLRDVKEVLGDGAMDPVRLFADACREELRLLQGIGRAGAGTRTGP